MQKSFVASLTLSFLLAFSVVSYLSSPFTVHVNTVRAAAEVLPVTNATTTSTLPFSNLNLVAFIEVQNNIAASSSQSDTTFTAAQRPKTHQAVFTDPHSFTTQTAQPVRLIIPSIGLSAPVDSVGLNDKGEMDVPNGDTTEVGWYKNGTLPGNVGSAVIDAHVFAAFDQLQNLKVGSEVYVENADGARLKFVVSDSRIYKLGELTSGMLFGKHDARRLNLITCAGAPTSDGSTYTHRLVVYTTLAA